MKEYQSNMDSIGLKRLKSDFRKVKIGRSEDGCQVIRQFYHDDITIYESFFLLLLNRSNNTIGYVKISQGGVAGTVVDVKLIVKYAVECLASAVILAHNHPSGNLQASNADLKITDKIKKALEYMDIKVLDHLIITEDSYMSMADQGLL